MSKTQGGRNWKHREGKATLQRPTMRIDGEQPPVYSRNKTEITNTVDSRNVSLETSNVGTANYSHSKLFTVAISKKEAQDHRREIAKNIRKN